MLHSLELVGTFALALSGARKRMDIFGIVVLDVAAALATGVRLVALRYRWAAPRPRL